jgi:hypothetical protein
MAKKEKNVEVVEVEVVETETTPEVNTSEVTAPGHATRAFRN